MKSQGRSKSGGSIVQQPTSTSTFTSNKALTEKLAAYQKFMSDYIVKAQEEKYKAVKSSELAIVKKYDEKLLLLSGKSSVSTPTESQPAASKEYVNRSAKLQAAAKAGKSRWGEGEVAKSVNTVVGSVGATAKAPVASPVKDDISVIDIPPEVAAADHGLRADGGVGGLSLAERVALGAVSSKAEPSAPIVAPMTLYQKRNARVSEAGKIGRSRWGQMEVDRATSLSIALLNSSPANGAAIAVDPRIVEEADHGLRADGGVGGPSLADRVNLGAQLLS